MWHLPGGHGVHPSVPREEELENVPKGHGWKYCTSESPDVRVNPEAISVATNFLFTYISGSRTLIASVLEMAGFLKTNKQTNKRTKKSYTFQFLWILKHFYHHLKRTKVAYFTSMKRFSVQRLGKRKWQFISFVFCWIVYLQIYCATMQAVREILQCIQRPFIY